MEDDIKKIKSNPMRRIVTPPKNKPDLTAIENMDDLSAGINGMVELNKSMDWKLWEILKIMQKIEKKLDNGSEANE